MSSRFSTRSRGVSAKKANSSCSFPLPFEKEMICRSSPSTESSKINLPSKPSETSNTRTKYFISLVCPDFWIMVPQFLALLELQYSLYRSWYLAGSFSNNSFFLSKGREAQKLSNKSCCTSVKIESLRSLNSGGKSFTFADPKLVLLSIL